MTDQEYLAAVESALQYILSGYAAEYETNGRRLSYLGITELNNLRNQLKASVARSSDGIFSVVEFRGGEGVESGMTDAMQAQRLVRPAAGDLEYRRAVARALKKPSAKRTDGKKDDRAKASSPRGPVRL